MNNKSLSGRRCLACGTVEAVEANEPIWPPGRQCPGCEHIVETGDGVPLFALELADTVSGMDPRSFEALSKVKAEHFWFVVRNEPIVGPANKFFPNARRFLEVGCGNGVVLRAIASMGTLGRVRIASVGTVTCATTPAVRCRACSDGCAPHSMYGDLTGAFDVIEHIADDEGVLRGMREATQTGGGVIVAVPQHPWMWSRAADIAYHQRRYQRGELEAKFVRNGFEVLF